jgi:hypothetical protein
VLRKDFTLSQEPFKKVSEMKTSLRPLLTGEALTREFLHENSLGRLRVAKAPLALPVPAVNATVAARWKTCQTKQQN